MEQRNLAVSKDEREGWTSASNAGSDTWCHGRHKAQLGLPELPSNPEATSGTRIHAWLEGNRERTLEDDDEQRTADMCAQIQERLVIDTFGGEETFTIKEERIWLEFDGLKHSGKTDEVVFGSEIVLITDYKTGRNEAPESPQNLQLRDQAALVYSKYGSKRIKVAIVQPWVTGNPEVCEYSEDDLKLALAMLKARVLACNAPEPIRLAGEVQCKYCRAKAECPEFIAAALPVPFEDSCPEIIVNCIKALPGDKLGLFLALVRLAEETAEAEVQTRLNAGSRVTGWELKPGRESEKIIDSQEVFTRALKLGITQQVFVSDCITVGKGKLEKALKEATGLKGKDLESAMETLIAGATETKTSAPALTKV